MADTILTLEAFEFTNLEVPQSIRFGGTQRLSVHELVGGTRVIDAMGRADAPLTWSGLLFGSGQIRRGGQLVKVAQSAIERARYLDGLRVAGAALPLKWGEFSYTVVVRDFSADYRKSYEIPYSITCEVVADLATQVAPDDSTPIDQAVQDDLDEITVQAAIVADPTLATRVSSLSAAISAVSSFAGAAQSVINSVLAPLNLVRQQVTTLIAAAGNTAQNVTTFGGVLPSNPASQSAAALSAQLANAEDSVALYRLRSASGRMNANLGTATTTQNAVPVAGGNLFRMAQQEYGDATAWTAIARANGLVDPFVQGSQTLKVPVQPDNSQGVLTA